MGLGTPEDLVEGVGSADMFDCVLPTRNARNGMLFTRILFDDHQKVLYAQNPAAGRPGMRLLYLSKSFPCLSLSLDVSKELLSYRLNTLHNLHYFMEPMSRAFRKPLSSTVSWNLKKIFIIREGVIMMNLFSGCCRSHGASGIGGSGGSGAGDMPE